METVYFEMCNNPDFWWVCRENVKTIFSYFYNLVKVTRKQMSYNGMMKSAAHHYWLVYFELLTKNLILIWFRSRENQ